MKVSIALVRCSVEAQGHAFDMSSISHWVHEILQQLSTFLSQVWWTGTGSDDTGSRKSLPPLVLKASQCTAILFLIQLCQT